MATQRSDSLRKKMRARVRATGAACALCGRPIDYDLPSSDPMSFELDHIIAIKRGGVDGIANVQASHRQPRLQPSQGLARCGSRREAQRVAGIIRDSGGVAHGPLPPFISALRGYGAFTHRELAVVLKPAPSRHIHQIDRPQGRAGHPPTAAIKTLRGYRPSASATWMNRPFAAKPRVSAGVRTENMTGIRAPRAPKGLEVAGKRLWGRVLADFELADHEEMILLQACRTVDLLDRLQAEIDKGDLLMTSTQGSRMHPAIVEFRQQTLTLAKLMASLRIPFGEEEAVPQQRSGVRKASLSAER